MKNIISIVALIFVSFSASAQITWEDAVSDTARGFETKDDIETHNNITFTKAGTYRWVRTFSEPCGIKSAICDKNSCYLETTDSMEFTVDASETFNMIVHFYPYNNCCTDAITLGLYIYKIDEPTENTQMDFNLDIWCSKSSVEDIETTPFSLSPNPTSNQLNIIGSLTDVYDVTVTNLQGQIIDVPSISANSLDVSSLTQGTYLVTILTEQAKYTQRFLKL